ncbi:hypothetical protein C900_02476 [Fulvivirga imtechensis AK7]|uniref:Uncharacterized protein n=1 Tax=Fulvivirga imtechensis AK7 TaxID=1237149 RepID=L8JRF4_9BACT|nr:hypothetical protein [Fulvivirga imtechensis]ELR71561.1 hypothetical protein C900_02476 [Fulvivirga imtechensis AK7]
MKTSKEKIIAGVVTAMFFTALGFALFYSADNKALNENLKNEKLKSEKMLSQKLALNKDIDKLKSEIQSYQGKNKQLDGKLADLYAKLTAKENELNALMKQRSLNESKLKKQISDLNDYKKQLQNEISGLNESLEDLRFKNSYLQNTVASLEKANKELSKKNDFLSKVAGDNYGVEAHKKNEKLTINARKTKAIVLGFDVPAHMADNLSLTVTTPVGIKHNNATSSAVTYQIINEEEPVLLASTDMVVTTNGHSKRVALSYKPKEKFKKGIYKIDIHHEGTYLGSSQIRLR